jgi:hypothetical protein
LTSLEVARIGSHDQRQPYVLAGVGSVAVLSSVEIALVDYTSLSPDGAPGRSLKK